MIFSWSFANQVTYPDVFVQDGIDIVVKVFLHVIFVETGGLFNVEYFLGCREGLTGVLLAVAFRVL